MVEILDQKTGERDMIFFIKTENQFRPVHKSDLDKWNKVKDNVVYCMRAKRDRNFRFHSKLFAIAKMIIDNIPEENPWSNKLPYQLIKASMIPLGFVEEIVSLDGEVSFIPESINFEDCGEDHFQEIYTAMIKYWADHFGYTVEELESNHDDYL